MLKIRRIVGSSAIVGIGYDNSTETLGVVFGTDPDVLYVYNEISEERVRQLKPDMSVGEWYNKWIRSSGKHSALKVSIKGYDFDGEDRVLDAAAC